MPPLLVVIAYTLLFMPQPLLGETTSTNFIQAIGLLGGLSGLAAAVTAIVTFRRFTVEKNSAETNRQVSLREVDVEELKAAFPGGVGEIIAHWKGEYELVVEQLTEAREDLRNVQEDCRDIGERERRGASRIRELEADMSNVTEQLQRARERISELERNGKNGK